MGEIAKREIIDAEIVSIDDAARSHRVDPAVMRQFVMDGDLGQIPPHQRPSLIMALCLHVGIDPIERPFAVFRDGKREVLYALRSCTSALCRERKISRDIISEPQEKVIAGQAMLVVRARATLESTGRHDESVGAVPVMQADTEWQNGRKVVKGWRMPDPNEAANLVMKAETKAKRRAVLDLVGLGIPDESEIDTIKGARIAQIDMKTGELREVAAIAAAPPESVTAPADKGTKTSGDIATTIDERLGALANLLKREKRQMWRAVLLSSGVDLTQYGEEWRKGPTRLTDADGQIVRSWLEAKLATMRSQSTSPNEVANSEDGDSARSRVLTTWQSLVDGAHVDPEGQADAFADWAGVKSWPNEPSGQLWAACLSGLEQWRSERGVQL